MDGLVVQTLSGLLVAGLQAEDEDDDGHDDADHDGGGGGDDDVVQPLGAAHPLRPDLPTLEHGCGNKFNRKYRTIRIAQNVHHEWCDEQVWKIGHFEQKITFKNWQFCSVKNLNCSKCQFFYL